MSSAGPNGNGQGRAKRPRDDGDIGNAMQSLQSLLEAKSKELGEKEEAFARKAARFELANPRAGEDNDIIKLNVAGTNKIAVARRALTHFEDSMLASKFSGRWDDSLDKDDEGNVFVDFDASEFTRLISYLRLCACEVRENVEIPAPSPTFAFCSMIEHHGLTPAICPSIWENIWGDFETVDKRECGHVVLKSSPLNKETGVIFESTQSNHGLVVSSFEVLAERGSEAKIGWSSKKTMGVQTTSNNTMFMLKAVQKSTPEQAFGSHNAFSFASPSQVGGSHNSRSSVNGFQFSGSRSAFGPHGGAFNAGVDLSNKVFVGHASGEEKLQEQCKFQGINIGAHDVTVICSCEGSDKHAIKAEGANLETRMSRTFTMQWPLHLVLVFVGAVTISNIQHRT